MNRAFIPLIWFEISASLTPELGWWINLALKVPVIGTASFFALFCLSLVVVATSGIILIRRRSGVHAIASTASGTSRRSNKQEGHQTEP